LFKIKNQKSFTLIELLVIIAMIAMVASIVLVRLQNVREKGRVAAGLNFSHTLQNSLGIEVAGIWILDEGSGSTVYDSSGYGNDGSVNGAEFTKHTPHSLVGAEGEKYALNFEGSDYVEINNLPVNIDQGAYTTVEFWMYWRGGNSEMPIGWQQPYSLWLVDGCFGFSTGQNNVLGISLAGMSDHWVHVVAVFYNGKPSVDTVSLYINGAIQDVYECRGSTSASRRVTPKLYVSGWAYGSGYKFHGIIDELRIYNTPLSVDQIKEHYLVGLKKHLSCK
jgi:uncharacterized membrane protein